MVDSLDMKNKETLSLRLDPAIVSRIVRVHAALGERAAGADLTRSAAVRAVVLAGLDALEGELGITKKAKR